MTTTASTCRCCQLSLFDHLSPEESCIALKAEWERAEKWRAVALHLSAEIVGFMASDFFATVMNSATEDESAAVRVTFQQLVDSLAQENAVDEATSPASTN